ncbi:sensor histidine kinase [Salisediminibacterium selenitireducens]|uniref:Signal transduction histidine-protein kinase/phosphatase DegS n=1 Tax=Bacillus selenitireducens (strain ATCC 700615 / DSM 15326 / MLS10) TaxID=439292 RepID=D6Y0E7_BACIE|nr:sensor histidine kinase [Salisediminibacterium selenitireducens]ADH98538.1 Histidine kinase [[Bacillus] selenitireducens MLS10]
MSTTKSIETILDRMMEMVSSSKEEIFEIGEQSRTEYEELKKELSTIQQDVIHLIDEQDQAEIRSRFARNRLAEVSKHFANYTDQEVKEAYEQAKDYQVRLAVLQSEEKQLRERRTQVERRLMKLGETVERAEQLINQINAVLQYLNGDLQSVSDMIQDAEQMQQFGVQIIHAQEEERKKLSREIHDGPAQMMANVMLRSELVEKVLDQEGPERARVEIRDLRRMVTESLSEVRRIIYDLRPMTLDDLGLVPTVAKFIDNVNDYQEQTEVNFRNLGSKERIPAHMEVAMFRFIQEAVQNAVKHAKANTISVKMEIKKTSVVAIVKDDGRGFDPVTKKENSFGLVGMKERVKLLDGDLTIDTKPGKGTLIMLQVPLPQDS